MMGTGMTRKMMKVREGADEMMRMLLMEMM